MIWWILGTLLIFASAYIVWKHVDDLKLGPHSSRFVSVVCAALGYFVIADRIAIAFPVLALGQIASPWITWLVPIFFLGWAGYYLYKTYKHWTEEFKPLIKNSRPLLFVVAFLVIARYCFAVPIN